MTEEKLVRYIQGEITSEAEIVEILDWIESSSKNQNEYTQLKNLWVATGLDYPDHVEVPAFPYPAARQIYPRRNITRSLLKYAAVFILAFLMGSGALYINNKSEREKLSLSYNTIYVPYGQRSRITLYDGTVVWLNSGTRLKYPILFDRNSREVSIEGEAYFEVAKDTSHPFVVNAGALKIEVLGTHFNVCAYTDDNEYSATLEEGSVKAFSTANGRNIELIPGEQVILNRETNELKHLKVDTRLYTSWKENKLKFEDAPFDEVIKKMERWYDVKITLDPAINIKEQYTMTIKTESLKEMLQLISKTTKIKYEIKENKLLIKNP